MGIHPHDDLRGVGVGIDDISDLLAVAALGPWAPLPIRYRKSGVRWYPDKRVGRKRPDRPLPPNRERTARQSWVFHSKRWERGT